MTTKEMLTEIRDDVEYELEAVCYKGKCVGLAPTKAYEDVNDMLRGLGEEGVFGLALRQLKQDVKNIVRGKFNKDKVTASAVLKAIEAGMLTPENIKQATDDLKSGKTKTFTDACATYLGIGEDAIKEADPTHIHWDCAK